MFSDEEVAKYSLIVFENIDWVIMDIYLWTLLIQCHRSCKGSTLQKHDFPDNIYVALVLNIYNLR